MNFLVMPSFFLSGALFPLQEAPNLLKNISLINPLTYGVDALRQILTGTGYFGIETDILILATLSTLLLIIGSYLFF